MLAGIQPVVGQGTDAVPVLSLIKPALPRWQPTDANFAELLSGTQGESTLLS